MNDYDYNLIANLSVNIRVSQEKIYRDAAGVELMREPLIEYSQAVLTHSDMEDILERANSVAENVTLYHKENSLTPDMTKDQLIASRDAITNAITTLVDNLTNVDFLTTYVTSVVRKSESSKAINRFVYKEEVDGKLTTVSLMYEPDILSAKLIYPRRPGAIVNNFTMKGF